MAVFGVSLVVASCASMFNPPGSEVMFRTNPAQADCDLSGRDGYRLTIQTPVTLTVPHSAAPITVSCLAPGFRRTVSTLDVTASGWIWGNSALLIATGGVAVLGLVVDEALGSDWTYRKDMSLDLDADRKRMLRARSRDGAQDLKLETR